MHPSFEQFVAALRDPALRSGIGLVIGDSDAAALLTRQDWANDYYYKWLALFPLAAAAAAATPAGIPASEPVAASVFDAGAPPSSGPLAGPPPLGAAPVTRDPLAGRPAAGGAPLWQTAPAASRIPSSAKVPLIVGASVLGAVLVAVLGVTVGGGLITAAATSHPVALSTPSSVTPPATATADAEPDTHGLTREEYDLLEAVVAPSGHSVEEAVAHGTTDAELRVTADQLKVQLADTCTGASKVPQGFDNAAYKAAFIAGYSVQQKVTPEQATVIYTALAGYCRATP